MSIKFKIEIVRQHLYACFNFIRNIYKFRNTLYRTVEWDHSGYFYFMEEMLTQQIKLFESDKATHKNAKKQANTMRIMRELVSRQVRGEQPDWWEYDMEGFTLDEETGMYTLNTGVTEKSPVVPRHTTYAYKIKRSIDQHNWDYLMSLISKNLNRFWD